MAVAAALLSLLAAASFIHVSCAPSPSCSSHAHDLDHHSHGHGHGHGHRGHEHLHAHGPGSHPPHHGPHVHGHGSHAGHGGDREIHAHHHGVDDGHGHGHGHGHHRHEHGAEGEHRSGQTGGFKLAEELAEEEELLLYGFDSHSGSEGNPHHHHHHHHHQHHHHQHSERSPVLGLWIPALGCSLLVSMASLICLILLPFIVAQGRPSRTVVDFLAAFGAGAMLGDAFLHQLPHALSGSHAHGVEHDHQDHGHNHHEHATEARGESGSHAHAHSIQDLSVGLAVLAGIILFFVVEKIVRQVEKSSKGALPWGLHHHHHPHREEEHDDAHAGDGDTQGQEIVPEKISSHDKPSVSTQEKQEPRRRKNAEKDSIKETTPLLSDKDKPGKKSPQKPLEEKEAPNLILGYLNLFSDGVHNFTDGMALGSAFLNHGTIGGWSRTLFLLAHEIPQEVGDFGVLLQSGFTVFKALAFNFLSALVALAGTALALLLGGSPENSSLIEGFTAGGFIYIAIAGVLPEMHRTGSSAKITFLQLAALGSGMSVALLISLIE